MLRRVEKLRKHYGSAFGRTPATLVKVLVNKRTTVDGERLKMRKTTVYDVAKAADVSIATVSFAFHHPEKVKPDTRERILKIADELGYIRNSAAASLAGSRANVLGLYAYDMMIEKGKQAQDNTIDPTVFPLYVDEVQRGFQLECWHHNKSVIISSGAEDRGKSAAEVADRVDGLAVYPSLLNEFASLTALSKQIPLVFFSMKKFDAPACFIDCDNADGIQQLLDHLCGEHQVRSIVFAGELGSDDVTQRYEAALRYSEEHHFPEVRLIEDATSSNSEFAHLLEAGTLPDAFVCCEDVTAISVIQQLHDAGYSVPRDVIVTGFDGILAGRISSPRLTTVRQPMESMGRFAAKVLEARNTEPFASPEEKVFPVKLVIGESCGCGASARG